jgi:predicted DNA-binding transcriptional regulator AlpA
MRERETSVEEYLSQRQLAALLQISISTLRRRYRHDQTFPPPIKTGQVMRWRRATIETWAAKRERAHTESIRRRVKA